MLVRPQMTSQSTGTVGLVPESNRSLVILMPKHIGYGHFYVERECQISSRRLKMTKIHSTGRSHDLG